MYVQGHSRTRQRLRRRLLPCSVTATCFYHLRQLRRIRRSLDADSAATLVHAFVTSRVDYCNAILAAAPKTITDRLQRVLNAAARVVSDTKKFDQRLSRLMHQDTLAGHSRAIKLQAGSAYTPVSARQGASDSLSHWIPTADLRQIFRCRGSHDSHWRFDESTRHR